MHIKCWRRLFVIRKPFASTLFFKFCGSFVMLSLPPNCTGPSANEVNFTWASGFRLDVCRLMTKYMNLLNSLEWRCSASSLLNVKNVLKAIGMAQGPCR